MGRAAKSGVVEISELNDDNRIVTSKTPKLLPVLPIRDTVYFPHQVSTVFVGRDKSVKAVDHATKFDHRILLVSQKSARVDNPTGSDLYRVGVLAKVLQVFRVPDETLRIFLKLIDRVKIVKYSEDSAFLQAETKILKETASMDITMEALRRSVTDRFQQLLEQLPNPPPNHPSHSDFIFEISDSDNPGEIADNIIPYLPIKVDAKQDLLETLNIKKRLEKLNTILTTEIEVLTIQNNIHSKVEKEMSDSQREYILREQLRIVQQELGTLAGTGSESEDYRAQVADAEMPEEVEAKAHKEIDKLDRMPFASPEGTVVRNYLDWLIDIPWNKSTQDRLDIDEAEQLLENEHYGLKKIKERIIEYLAVRKLSNELKGPILCFVGPPGVGKTSIGKSIAESLGRKFHRLSLGGVRDEAEIRGHRRTYIGALPGRIIQGIKQVGTNNPVFMLDEIDKLGQDFRGDPSSALLEALDPEQNYSFTDHYLEAPFNLRNVMFITTANMLDTIPAALRDRMEIIQFSGYVDEEKQQIAKKFLLPKQIRENGLSEKLIEIEDSAINLIIRHYTREAGVRELERLIGTICRKVATKVAKGKKTSTKIGDANLSNFLGRKKYHYGRMEEKDSIAIATGLVYTDAGGDIISIEVVPMKSDKGNFVLTGQLGDVMKESGQAALTYIRSRASQLSIDEMLFSKLDLHIHVPAGAVPKDGPSAGITLATAIASALTKRAVRSDVAMTGEITLTGRVLPVGGIKEKVLAAHRSGIRTVIMPEENEPDLDDLPNDVRAGMTFKLVQHADDVLKIALVDK